MREVVSLVSDPKTDATSREYILTCDHTAYLPGHLDEIRANPCCAHYSRARRGAKTPRNLVWADSSVVPAHEIIEYFEPRVWFIEDPQAGMLKDSFYDR